MPNTLSTSRADWLLWQVVPSTTFRSASLHRLPKLHPLTPHHSEIIYPRNLPPGARTEVPRPSQFGLNNAEELMLPTPDGERISAFLIKPDSLAQTRPITIVSFHGNAGNVGHRLPIARILSNELLCNTLMVEYRGCGYHHPRSKINLLTKLRQTVYQPAVQTRRVSPSTRRQLWISCEAAKTSRIPR